jgi:hypothetical protein
MRRMQHTPPSITCLCVRAPAIAVSCVYVRVRRTVADVKDKVVRGGARREQRQRRAPIVLGAPHVADHRYAERRRVARALGCREVERRAPLAAGRVAYAVKVARGGREAGEDRGVRKRLVVRRAAARDALIQSGGRGAVLYGRVRVPEGLPRDRHARPCGTPGEGDVHADRSGDVDTPVGLSDLLRARAGVFW